MLEWRVNTGDNGETLHQLDPLESRTILHETYVESDLIPKGINSEILKIL